MEIDLLEKKSNLPRSRLYGGVILIGGYVRCINGKGNAMGI
jgi:hypothetical protein